MKTVEEIAKELHEEYENQARIFGWVTQETCRVDFLDLPEANIKTMLGLAAHVRRLVLEGKIEENKNWHEWAKPSGGESIGPLYTMGISNAISSIKEHAKTRIAELEKELEGKG